MGMDPPALGLRSDFLLPRRQFTFYWNLKRVAAETHGFGPSDDEHPGSWEDMCSR